MSPDRNTWIFAALLLVLVGGVYLPVKDHGFIDLDDDVYVTHNPKVQEGLTLANLKWGLTTLEAGFWHPLTWWSHMLDCQLFGLEPAGHHLVNLTLHLLSSLLLFGLLRVMTDSFWRSLLVAFLFALHPLNVESVAWVAERKNVLSTLFWMLTLWAYWYYLRRPGALRYASLIGLFLLGLMAKPMLVTLPCVLLLLDYWPLRRLGDSAGRPSKTLVGLIQEKLPLFGLSLASGVATIWAQQQLGALPSLDAIPWDLRLANAATSYLSYLGKLIWPVHLAIFYPYPETIPGWSFLISALLLVGVSVVLWWRADRYPFLLVGWLWYLGTLLPVSGLLQVGQHAMADRYLYLPMIGPLVMGVWGVAALLEKVGAPRLTGWVAALTLVLVTSVAARRQLGYWESSATLLEQATRVTGNNFVAHNNLGTVWLKKGEVDRAMQEFSEVLRIQPESAQGLYNMGLALQTRGDRAQASVFFERAIGSNPRLAGAHNNLGLIRMADQQLEQAASHFSQALEANPTLVEAHENLATALVGLGHHREALSHLRTAVAIDPDRAQTHNNLGAALDLMGQTEEAIRSYRRALQLSPNSDLTLGNLGMTLLQRGELEEATQYLEQRTRIRPDLAEAHFQLGLARTQQGNRQQAIASFSRTLALDPNHQKARHELASLLEGATQ